MPAQAAVVKSVQIALLSIASALLVALAMWSATEPGISVWLAFGQAQIADGEWWRVLTGFIAHWTLAHVAANGLGIALFAWLIARREGSPALVKLMMLSLVLQLPCLFALPGNAEYRGASGFLYTLAVFAWLRSIGIRGWPALLWLPAIAALVHLAIDFSGASASSLLPAGVVTAWPVHVAGIGAALLGFWVTRQPSPNRQPHDARSQKRIGVA